jgi:two-component system NtrC family sensor kinase
MDAIQRPDGEISITSAYVNKEFKVLVTDNGKGIPQTQLSRIFEPFYTTKSVGKGTGLGLSVCLRVIKEHMGNIQVESQPGQGTKFTVILPDINRNV